MRERRQTVEHPFGTIKSWMGATHFQIKKLKNVGTEMAPHVLAYNMKRVISILGVAGLMEAIRACACRARPPKNSRFHTGWVKRPKSLEDQMFSGPPLTTDFPGQARLVSFMPTTRDIAAEPSSLICAPPLCLPFELKGISN
jgi:hypothetical protein